MRLRSLASGLNQQINRFRAVRPATMAMLAARDPLCFAQVHPSWPAPWPRKLPSGPIPSLLSSRLRDAVLPAQGVLTLRRASVLSDDGWIFTDSGHIAVDTTLHATAVEWMPRIHQPLFRIGERRLKGRTLSLLSTWAAFNFYHLLLETLPRIDLVFRAGFTWHDFDHVLLPSFSSPTVDRLLALLDFPRHKVIALTPRSWDFFRTDELVCTSFPGAYCVVAPTSVAYLRGLHAALPTAAPTRRQLFVRRGSATRRLRNEDDLAALAAARGFVIIDPSAASDMEHAFAHADVIVGVHGAALANLAFCRPGTQVLELLPGAQAYPYFFTLAVSGGLQYDCIIGPSDVEHEPHHPMQPRNSVHDFTIDRAAYIAALDRIVAV